MTIIAAIILIVLLFEVRETLRNSRDRAYRRSRVHEFERNL